MGPRSPGSELLASPNQATGPSLLSHPAVKGGTEQMEDQEGEGKPRVTKERILCLPPLSGVSIPPLQGVQTGAASSYWSYAPHRPAPQQGPWWSPSQHSPSESWLLAPHLHHHGNLFLSDLPQPHPIQVLDTWGEKQEGREMCWGRCLMFGIRASGFRFWLSQMTLDRSSSPFCSHPGSGLSHLLGNSGVK